MYNYCCVFCARSLAIFKSLDLEPLKASMGIAGNHPVFPSDASASWQTQAERFAALPCSPPPAGRLWCRGLVWPADCTGGGVVGAGFEFSALIKVGCRAPLCSVMLPSIRGFTSPAV